MEGIAVVVPRGRGPAFQSGRQDSSKVRLLTELYAEVRSARVRLALFAALLLGGLALIDSLALASILFTGPLSHFVLNGTSMLLLGHIACFLVVALMSSHRGMVAIPQEAPAAVLAAVGVTLTEVMAGASDASRFMTMVVLLIFTSVTTSLCLLLLGRYRIVRLLRLIPYPVTAGFLAGTGCILCVFALSVMSGLQPDVRALPRLFEAGMPWKWGPGAVYGVALWLLMKSRWGGPRALAASFAVAVVLYHAGLAAGGISTEEARESGLLVSGVPDHSLWLPFAVRDLGLADWRTVAALAPSVLPAILVTILCLASYVSGIELDTGAELDADREFRVAGVAGLVAAAEWQRARIPVVGLHVDLSQAGRRRAADRRGRSRGGDTRSIVRLRPPGSDPDTARCGGTALRGRRSAGDLADRRPQETGPHGVWRRAADLLYGSLRRVQRGSRRRRARDDSARRGTALSKGSDRSRVYRA